MTAPVPATSDGQRWRAACAVRGCGAAPEPEEAVPSTGPRRSGRAGRSLPSVKQALRCVPMTRESRQGGPEWAPFAEPDTGPVEGEPDPSAPPPAARPEVDVERLRQALADLEDAKGRVRRDADRQREVLRGEVLAGLLPVLDNLDRSIASAEDAASDSDAGALLSGVKLVCEQFIGVLADFGLERRSARGARFDPRLHDAVAVVPVADPALDGTVVDEQAPGYFLGERVVRPARVLVGRAARRAPA